MIVEDKDPGARILQWKRLRRVPYAATLIRRLSEKYRLAVVSGKVEVGEALGRVRLREYFDAIITSVDVGCEKPYPKIFKCALDALGIRPGEAVMIGDRVDTDICGANGAGITTVLHRWRNRYRMPICRSLSKPSYSVKSLREVERVLKEIESLKG